MSRGNLFQDGISLNERVVFQRGMSLKRHDWVDHRSMMIEISESRLTSIEQLRAFLDGIALGRRHAVAHDEARVLAHDDGFDLGAAQINADAHRYGKVDPYGRVQAPRPKKAGGDRRKRPARG
jgi:hypothetical protein